MAAAFNAPAAAAPARLAEPVPAPLPPAAGSPPVVPAFAALGPISLMLRTPALAVPPPSVTAPAPLPAPAGGAKTVKGAKMMTVKLPLVNRSSAQPWSPRVQPADPWIQPVSRQPDDLGPRAPATDGLGRRLLGTPRAL
jgi:hypothetical protein